MLLGQAQPTQFQSADQTGYIWGSIYEGNPDGTANPNRILNTVGNTVTIDGDEYLVNVNGNSVIPRSYNKGGDTSPDYRYNWYSATAESGKYNTAQNTVTTDSICPSGWQLPSGRSDSTVRSLAGLMTYYSTGNELKSSPITASMTGLYNYVTGKMINPTEIRWWSNTVSSYMAATMLRLDSNGLTLYGSAQTHGGGVRCVKRN